MKKQIQYKTFYWKGTDHHGNHKSGQIEALNKRFVKVELLKNKIIAKKIWLKHSFPNLFAWKKNISKKNITLFLRQIATLIQSGIPILQALESIRRSTSKIKIQQLIQTIISDIQQGHSLSYALQKHSKHFDHFLCHLITIGETSGTLDIMFDRITSHREKTERLKAKIKKALLYPTITVFVAVLVVSIMLIFVIPQFESLFTNYGESLPLLTRLTIRTSQWTIKYGWIALTLIGLTLLSIFYLNRASLYCKKRADALFLKLPLVGTLFKKNLAARLTRTLVTTCSAGITITDALEHAKDLTSNTVFYDAILQVKTSILHGKSLHLALQETQMFHNMMIQMVAIGEEAGKLNEMLNHIAEHYESEIDQTLDELSLLIEPIMMVVLGIIIGGLVIAMYLPIFKLGTVI